MASSSSLYQLTGSIDRAGPGCPNNLVDCFQSCKIPIKMKKFYLSNSLIDVSRSKSRDILYVGMVCAYLFPLSRFITAAPGEPSMIS